MPSQLKIGGCVIVACLALCGCGSPEQAADVSSSEWMPLRASQSYAGKSLEEWVSAFDQWWYSATDCEMTTDGDEDGSWCGLYQDPDSDMFFFDLGPKDTVRTKCRVPRGKAIMVPISVWPVENIGQDPQLSEDELRQSAQAIKDSMRELQLTVDGTAVVNAEQYGQGPLRLSHRVPPAPNYYTCNQIAELADAVVEPSFLVGYFAILPPPVEPGKHQLKYGSILTTPWNEPYEATVDTTFLVEDEDADE